MAFTHDVLVLGRGLAGAVLTETLLQRGVRVHVFDSKRPGNASMVAAGVVNPVVLRRDVPSWRAMELLPLAERFYSSLERHLGARFWHPIELVKLFAGPHEEVQWERAMKDPATASLIDRREHHSVDVAPLRAYHGHGTVLRSAWLNVPAMLGSQRRWLLKIGLLTEGNINDADIEHLATGVRIGTRSAPLLVRCTGPFSTLPGLVPVKGEGLTARIPALHVDRMLHRGIFLLPVDHHTYRVGSTFRWDSVWDGPSTEARNWLLEKLGNLINTEHLLLDQWCGVRPTSMDRRPILGRVSPNEAVFNGLGARGVLLAPWCATQLTDHLLDGKPLEAEVRHDRAFLQH